MRTSTLLIGGLSVLASTTYGKFCIKDRHAQVIANNFAQLISNYTAAFANEVIADNYIDQADSVNTLINSGTELPIPLGSLTFDSKAAFLAAQSGQPNVPFEILNLWHTCDTVLIRWVSAQEPQPVQGFDALIVEKAPKKSPQDYLINTVYGEFNSGAWLANLGRPECAAAPARRGRA